VGTTIPKPRRGAPYVCSVRRVFFSGTVSSPELGIPLPELFLSRRLRTSSRIGMDSMQYIHTPDRRSGWRIWITPISSRFEYPLHTWSHHPATPKPSSYTVQALWSPDPANQRPLWSPRGVRIRSMQLPRRGPRSNCFKRRSSGDGRGATPSCIPALDPVSQAQRRHGSFEEDTPSFASCSGRCCPIGVHVIPGEMVNVELMYIPGSYCSVTCITAWGGGGGGHQKTHKRPSAAQKRAA